LFDNDAEEAAKFYTSIFKNSKILDTVHYGESAAEVSGRPKGTVMTVMFELDGQRLMALNGGPVFNFSPAISFFVNCETQEEVDDLWEKLSKGGEKEQVRLVERQVWRVMADRSQCLGLNGAG
jgi:predicted 3-demethylubiquinone-9 3-methyltransferase (glyoxalase superfamily)